MNDQYLEYSEIPETFVPYTSNSTLINYNVRTKNNNIDGTEIPTYICDFIIVSNVDKDSIVDALVKKRYNVSQELSLLRQKEVKESEFTEYFNYVEQCKKIAEDIISKV